METNTTSVTVSDILDRYARECVPKLAPRTQRDYARHIEHLRRAFGSRVAADLKPRDFGPFLQVQRGPHQRVRQLAVLSSAFTHAVSYWFLLERNVLRDVKRMKGVPRDRLVEQHEFDAVLAIAPLRVRLMMRLALKIGQRQGDLLNMKWTDIKPSEVGQDCIHLYQSKTSKRLAIAIDKELEAILDECWQLPNRGEYIITRKIGGRYTSEGFRALWQRTIKRYMRRGGQNFHFHDLRALCATRCPSLEFAQALLGHTSPAMTRRVYRRGVEYVQALPTSKSVTPLTQST